MNIDNLENHMVLNTADAPWNQPDADDSCEECGGRPATEILIGKSWKTLCAKCDEEQATKREHRWWEEALRDAAPGDVVVTLDDGGIRHILSVREKGTTCLHGDGFRLRGNGSIYAYTAGDTISYTDFTGLLVVEIVSLG